MYSRVSLSSHYHFLAEFREERLDKTRDRGRELSAPQIHASN